MIHCFNGIWAVAEEYLKLGYHIGIGGKFLRRARNTSPTLPAVIEKFALLKGISEDTEEMAAAEYAMRLFALPTRKNEG